MARITIKYNINITYIDMVSIKLTTVDKTQELPAGRE